jgi:hypothetical protein
LYGAEIADGRMPAFWVIELFNVIEDIHAQFVSGTVLPSAEALHRQGGEEAFHGGVAPAISTATHAANDAVLVQQLLEVFTGVLGGFNRSSQRCLWPVTAEYAVNNASMTNYAVMVGCIDPLTTHREYRRYITATNS